MQDASAAADEEKSEEQRPAAEAGLMRGALARSIRSFARMRFVVLSRTRS